jgi:hypothetical protein
MTAASTPGHGEDRSADAGRQTLGRPARRDAEGRVTGATLYHFPFASREMIKIE